MIRMTLLMVMVTPLIIIIIIMVTHAAHDYGDTAHGVGDAA